MVSHKTYLSCSYEETERLGQEIFRALTGNKKAPLTILIAGPLGAGKSVFVRGIIRGLGIGGRVLSPTYTLLRSYTGTDGRRVHHLDLYRTEPGFNLAHLGIGMSASEILLIEWPERLQTIPSGAVMVRISGETERKITVEGLIR